MLSCVGECRDSARNSSSMEGMPGLGGSGPNTASSLGEDARAGAHVLRYAACFHLVCTELIRSKDLNTQDIESTIAKHGNIFFCEIVGCPGFAWP